jgi:alpha-1,2-mannosyltransferase
MARSRWVTLLAIIPLTIFVVPLLIQAVFRLWGWFLRTGTKDRRHAIYSHLKQDRSASRQRRKRLSTDDDWEKVGDSATPEDASDQWEGIVGFFHPFCNAGGGGERVLWAAIAATQRQLPHAVCAVYTGDHEIDKLAIIAKVEERFGIVLREDSITFIYLTTRHFVLASNYPYFTLLGQSLGSLVLAWDAFHLLVPDIFIDTMGYAFALAFCKYLFPHVPTGAYVHYPTISTDMLSSLDDKTGMKGINAGRGSGTRGQIKRHYWHLFARLYGWVGRSVDVVMCNSTWTQNHILSLWTPHQAPTKSPTATPFATILYPPCPVESLINRVPLSQSASTTRSKSNIILYIAQFRPEKNHSLVLRAFARYAHSSSAPGASTARLVMIGSVRANTPDERHIYALRIEARELHVNDTTTFITDAPFSVIEEYLAKANIGVNGMYAEHFGIGNVEGLAAGLIPVVHRSGGPYLDIVVPFDGLPIGFHAETEEEFAKGFEMVNALSEVERAEMRVRGRESSRRFGEEVFVQGWNRQLMRLVHLQRERRKMLLS